MANWKADSDGVPWLPVHNDNNSHDQLAPSKPAVPVTSTRHAPPLQPQPIEVDDAGSDIIAAVTPPPPEEVMPTDAKAAWEGAPVFSVPTDPAATPSGDAIRSLGDAAVLRASLSASGAAMPLGGVAPAATPSPAVPSPVTTTPAATSAPAVPTSPGLPAVSPARASAFPATTTAPGFMDTKPPTSPEPSPGSLAPELEDDSPPFTPIFGTPTVPDSTGSDQGDGSEPPTEDKGRPWWRSWPFLVILGLLVMGGIGYAVVTVLSDDEPVELTQPVIVPSPEQPTHDAIGIEDPTEFQAALPENVGLYALTAVETPELSTLDLMVRAAEATLLTYQYEDVTLSVRAIQHFDVETATQHFEGIAADGTDRAPVAAGGADVGERVTISAEDSETIVWSNTTALFFVTGPADAAEEFFTQFPM